MIKKVVMVFLAALLCVVFTSCDSGPSRYEQAGSMGEDIMECIKNGDVEKLSGYFSSFAVAFFVLLISSNANIANI